MATQPACSVSTLVTCDRPRNNTDKEIAMLAAPT
jgi:hypothetical protein